MAYKTVTTVITDPETEDSALQAAIKLTKQQTGHLDVMCLGIDRTQPGLYYSGTNAIAMQTSLAEAERRANELETQLENSLKSEDCSWATHSLASQVGSLPHILAYNMRFSDIAVLARPYGEGRRHEHEAIIEAVMFDASVPVLIMPETAELPDRMDRIVVAWNESREALHAVRRALPLLRAAEVVNVAIIDPPVHAPDRSDPGGALSQMLSRHGVHAELSILAKTMPRVSEVIERHVSDQNADLLVMGAYGHSRFRESILGGATRNILQSAELPVFMAH